MLPQRDLLLTEKILIATLFFKSILFNRKDCTLKTSNKYMKKYANYYICSSTIIHIISYHT